MESEALTRKRRIDGSLENAGWKIIPYSESLNLAGLHCHAVEELPTDNGPADYGLFVEGALVGVVEAKKVSLGPQNVLVQAERYSRGATQSTLDFRGFRVPFLYATNGEVIWFHDVRHELECSRRITRFHTPASLKERLTRDFEADCDRLLHAPNIHPRLRPYQIDANAATEAAIAHRKRQMLVAMAANAKCSWRWRRAPERHSRQSIKSIDS
jgi:type I restriction enzyme R subunit